MNSATLNCHPVRLTYALKQEVKSLAGLVLEVPRYLVTYSRMKKNFATIITNKQTLKELSTWEKIIEVCNQFLELKEDCELVKGAYERTLARKEEEAKELDEVVEALFPKTEEGKLALLLDAMQDIYSKTFQEYFKNEPLKFRHEKSSQGYQCIILYGEKKQKRLGSVGYSIEGEMFYYQSIDGEIQEETEPFLCVTRLLDSPEVIKITNPSPAEPPSFKGFAKKNTPARKPQKDSPKETQTETEVKAEVEVSNESAFNLNDDDELEKLKALDKHLHPFKTDEEG